MRLWEEKYYAGMCGATCSTLEEHMCTCSLFSTSVSSVTITDSVQWEIIE